MHIVKLDPKAVYNITDDSGNELEIEKNKFEEDLDITIGDDLKCTGHINRKVEKANRILGMFKRTFVSRDLWLWKDLYVFLVRPHLEYSVQAWNRH